MKKHIKLFEEYTEQQNDGHPGFLQSEEEIHAWLEEFDSNYSENTYTINSDMTVDVDGGVNIGYNKLNYILVEFNYVSGYFWCSDNKLISLEGVPTEVNGHFDCSHNKLTSLEGAPQKVGRSFYCSENNLTTLEGAPQYVGGDFHCYNNNLTTLQYAPDVVHGDFYCKGNEDLVTFAHKSNIQGKFVHDELQGTIEERIERYINYLDTLDMEEKRSSLMWLYDVDEDFRELVVKYAAYNNINLPGVDLSIAKDALKHNDSGLF